MGEPAMELGEKELEKIGSYVQSHLPEWMGEIRRERELNLVERIVRVEEGLKNMHEVMEARFTAVLSELRSESKAVNQRFEDINKRFEDVNKHFDNVNERFEDVNKRFDDVNERFEDVNKRFDDVNERFEDVNKRFDDVNERFEDVNKRFEDMDKRFSQVQWMMGLGFTLLAILMGVFNFF